MGNPIYESKRYRREIAEARELEEELKDRFPELAKVRVIVGGAGLDPNSIDLTGAPAAFWAAILDFAARALAIESLLKSVEQALRPAPKDAQMRGVIDRVQHVAEASGSLSPMRLLLKGKRPFLARTTLRGVLNELRDWESPASILVVRGNPDSGRTETQYLLSDESDYTKERFRLRPETLPLDSTLRDIWKAAKATGNPPSMGQETVTTESAMLIDFWTDVRDALERNDLYLWLYSTTSTRVPAGSQCVRWQKCWLSGSGIAASSDASGLSCSDTRNRNSQRRWRMRSCATT